MELLPAVETETGDNPRHAVIWLHGLGADGHDFAPIVPELGLGGTQPPVRFIFPHAPQRPVTVNGGYIMPAWYDIHEMEIDRKVDTPGLLASAAAVTALLDRETARGIDSRQIIVAGFSQGGAVAYQVALSCPQPLGGLLAMSSYFATAATIEYHPANSQLPIAIHHGTFDPVVPEALGREAAAILTRAGYRPTYRSYPMEHGVCPAQISDIGDWLKALLNS